MRQTVKRRYTPDGTLLTKVRQARRAWDTATDKALVAESALAASLLEAASAGWTMRELAEVSGLTLSTVYRRITEAEQAA